MELIQTILRALEFLWILLITALIGNVIDDASNGNPASINYAIFVAVFCWIVLIYGLAASFMDSLAIPMVLLAMDGLATIFTFIAAVVLAAELGVHSCSNPNYTHNNHMTNGAHNYEERCRELQASCAFFWFLFATYCVNLFFDVKGKGGSSSRSTSTRKGPVMTQV